MSFTEDFDTLFSETAMPDLGDDLIHLPNAGGSVAFSGVFSEIYKANDMGLVIDINTPNIFCSLADVPGITVVDTLQHNAVTYGITSIEPDGYGQAIIILRKI